MKKVIVASHNPVKLAAVREGFERIFPGEVFVVEGMAVASGVSDQPRSNEETRAGAIQRSAAVATASRGDFYIGIEGGVSTNEDGMEAFAWVAVQDAVGRKGKARSAGFFLPPRVAALIGEGKELGEADDIVFGRVNSKQENGAIGLLTGNAIDRKSYYREAVIMALIPFKNKTLYHIS
ncbi:MAG: inosine/xanthosine triphosphatase [Patescibacteria group bacterium]